MSAAEPTGEDLHPLVSGFTDAEAYDRGRAPYDEHVVEAMLEPLGLSAGCEVLELGAGTGQLSRGLLAAGLRLTAVEPLAATRGMLAAVIGQERVMIGVAEQIPLAEDSVDGVLVAEAFHWFDEERAPAEIARVLRPGGGVAIMRSMPMLGEAWARELGPILNPVRPEHPAFRERGYAAALEEDAAFGPVSAKVITSAVTQERSRVLAYFASISWVARLPSEQRSEVIGQIEALMERHGIKIIDYETRHEIWSARLV